jgi:hypothetical protein
MDTTLSRPYKVVFYLPDFTQLSQNRHNPSIFVDENGEYSVTISENYRQKAKILSNYRKQTTMHIFSLNLNNAK